MEARTDSQNGQLLTAAQAAAYANCNVRTIYRAIGSGRLRCAKLGSAKAYRIRTAWLDDWIDASAERTRWH